MRAFKFQKRKLKKMSKNHRRMESANIEVPTNSRKMADAPPSAQKTEKEADSMVSPGVSIDDMPYETERRKTETLND